METEQIFIVTTANTVRSTVAVCKSREEAVAAALAHRDATGYLPGIVSMSADAYRRLVWAEWHGTAQTDTPTVVVS